MMRWTLLPKSLLLYLVNVSHGGHILKATTHQQRSSFKGSLPRSWLKLMCALQVCWLDIEAASINSISIFLINLR
ncbi:hypothetical protein DER46DRAFT_598962 [Fusarium sp. MPI-SDFR-AT-0072]|nr:hypothetical protein DER46DRAFT_598962 [Fusarium sp. MPI-SDFR-AT-0072]